MARRPAASEQAGWQVWVVGRRWADRTEGQL